MNEFAHAELRRAGQALETARMVTTSDPNAAASRAYYAAFHATTAAFAARGRVFSKHTEIRAAIHRDLITFGEVPMEIGADFDELLALRNIGDYGGASDVDPADANAAIEAANRILKCMSELISNLQTR